MYRKLVELSDEERKARKKVSNKKYNASPKGKASRRRAKPKNKERMKEYNKKPKVITKRKEYNASPKRKAVSKERWQKPEVKKVQKKYRASPQGKAKMKEYFTSDKVKTKKNDIYAKFDKKAKIIIARGNLECACCGNKNFQWLQIDHIVPQRKKSRDHVGILRREIAQGKRPDSEFQLLCANCNFAKRDLKACPIDHSLD